MTALQWVGGSGMVECAHPIYAIMTGLAMCTGIDLMRFHEFYVTMEVAVQAGSVGRTMGELAGVAGVAVKGLRIISNLVPVQAEGGVGVVKERLRRQAGVKLATTVFAVAGMAAPR